MASRSRTVIPNLSNRENGVTVRGKGGLGLVQQKRSALGEIGNKVTNFRSATLGIGKTTLSRQPVEQHQLKKPVLLKQKSEDIIKPSEKIVQTLVHKNVVKSETPAVIPLVDEPDIIPDKSEDVSFSSDLLVEDIDIDDAGNPILVSEYSNDIYQHLRDLEKQTPINPGFLNGQEVTPKMRSVLINWLVEVHQQFHLTQESLYLTVAIVDRFLQAERSIDRKRLQLLGVTAMFVASKYEEMYAPDINDFVYITDNSYTAKEVIKMEMVILARLNFSLGRPLPLQFLRRYSKAGKAMAVHHTMAKYFLEESLIHYEMCHYPPSLIAAAALHLSFFVLGSEDSDCGDKKLIWTPTLAHYSTYKQDDLIPVVRQIAAIILSVDESKYQAVRKKYTQSKHMKISMRSELKSPSMIKLAAHTEKQA